MSTETTEGPFVAPAIDEAPPPPPELEALSPSRRAMRRAPARQIAEGWQALLHNRFILSALSVVAVLLLTAIVLVVIGQGSGDTTGDTSSNGGVLSGRGKTPVRPVGGLAGTTKTTATFRNGPGPTYVVLGTIPRGAVLAVIGRNKDQSWLQVRYPPNSTLKGWVDAQFLDVDGDLTTLVIAGPGPVPSVAVTFVPTFVATQPSATETTEAEPGVTRTARPVRTPTARPTRPPTRTPRQFTTPTPPPDLASATPLATPHG
jgi:uncharacterized protein YraI